MIPLWGEVVAAVPAPVHRRPAFDYLTLDPRLGDLQMERALAARDHAHICGWLGDGVQIALPAGWASRRSDLQSSTGPDLPVSVLCPCAVAPAQCCVAAHVHPLALIVEIRAL